MRLVHARYNEVTLQSITRVLVEPKNVDMLEIIEAYCCVLKDFQISGGNNAYLHCIGTKH